MNKIQKYLQDAKNNASAKFAHADGEFGSSTKNGDKGFSNATGSMPASMTKAPTSQPYVINVTSTSGSPVADFSILGSNTFLYGSAGATWTNGSLVIGSITISSGTPGVTYQQMLAQFTQQPFTCGLTYYKSSTAGQIDQILSVITRDANGNSQTMPIVPTIDPYQQQSNVIVIPNVFTVDGFTSVVIASVLANATVTFQLYPADKINLARGLDNQSVGANYSNPGIVKAQEVVVKG